MRHWRVPEALDRGEVAPLLDSPNRLKQRMLLVGSISPCSGSALTSDYPFFDSFHRAITPGG